MIEKIKFLILNFLNAIKSSIMPSKDLIPNPDNKTTSIFIEKSINTFRNRNSLIPFIHNNSLEKITIEYSYDMAKKNRIVYDMKGLRLSFMLYQNNIFCKNVHLIPVYSQHECSPDDFTREILANTISRNILLSDNFYYVAVAVFNNYCTVILTSKF
jgi:hypothetical protein